MGRRLWLAAVACAVGGWCAAAAAQTFYKWTDERGLVHFSDQPPVRSGGVEERHLAVPPAASRPAEEAPAPADVAGGAEPAAAGYEGPARVILVSRQAPRIGPSAVHITGEVKNVGGADARRVAVTLSAVDITQGTPCLQGEAAVAPPTLRPGDKGNFDADIDSPCLYGDTQVDVTPVWE
jgi:hypothetical protein